MEKMTKKEYFGAIAEIVKGADTDNRDEILAFIDRQVELLSKKSNTKTKTQKENEVLVEGVYDALVAIEKPVTVTELQEANEDMAAYSNQKLSALLRMLVNAGRVVKTVDKKKSYFSVNAE